MVHIVVSLNWVHLQPPQMGKDERQPEMERFGRHPTDQIETAPRGCGAVLCSWWRWGRVDSTARHSATSPPYPVAPAAL
jgi:hypothetical protein